MAELNSMSKNFILDLVSALDYLDDIETHLNECEKESIHCDIKYLKDKVSDIKFDLKNSIMDHLRNDTDDKEWFTFINVYVKDKLFTLSITQIMLH